MNHDTPTALEALRPTVECDTAELLRFLNFTTALGEWWRHRTRYLAANDPKQTREIGYWLYHHTIDLQLRLYRYEAATHNGSNYHLDREFLALFPPRIPMNDGTLLTMVDVLKLLKRVKEMTASCACGLKTT